MAGIDGLNAYQQMSQIYNQNTKKTAQTERKAQVPNTQSKVQEKSAGNVKTTEWKPIDMKSSLVPSKVDGIGMAIGNVELSDKAKDYYSQLKSKFGNMEFIAVSKDMKSQVQANAAAYGNAQKMVVLIDDEKLERMANDESFRKKYEGIIAMSQNQLTAAKNSLAGSGAAIKNFGMSVNSDGSTDFFATLEKSSADQTKRIQKKQAEKKAAKVKEKKQAEKKAQEKRLEKAKEEKKAEKAKAEEKLKDDTKGAETLGDDSEETISAEDREYVQIKADSLDGLMNKISRYAFDRASASVMTDAERSVGQHFDLKF